MSKLKVGKRYTLIRSSGSKVTGVILSEGIVIKLKDENGHLRFIQPGEVCTVIKINYSHLSNKQSAIIPKSRNSKKHSKKFKSLFKVSSFKKRVGIGLTAKVKKRSKKVLAASIERNRGGFSEGCSCGNNSSSTYVTSSKRRS